jgi:hypothetical protein
VHVIDRVVDGIGGIPQQVSSLPRRLHGGLVSSYALVMWAGAIAGTLWMLGAFR